MQLKLGEKNKLNKIDEIKFSSEVAETLGINAAIILRYIQDHDAGIISDLSFFKAEIKKKLPFLNHGEIHDSVEKLRSLKLITVKHEKLKLSARANSQNFTGATCMHTEWLPSPETYEVLELGGISRDFSESKIKEFRLYWIEKNLKKDNWNIIFINFVRKSWVEFNSENQGLPFTMNDNWKPSDSALDVLEMAEIKKESALKYLKEFILFWQESGTALKTWNVKFIDFVKRKELGSYNVKNEPGQFTKNFQERQDDKSWTEEFD